MKGRFFDLTIYYLFWIISCFLLSSFQPVFASESPTLSPFSFSTLTSTPSGTITVSNSYISGNTTYTAGNTLVISSPTSSAISSQTSTPAFIMSPSAFTISTNPTSGETGILTTTSTTPSGSLMLTTTPVLNSSTTQISTNLHQGINLTNINEKITPLSVSGVTSLDVVPSLTHIVQTSPSATILAGNSANGSYTTLSNASGTSTSGLTTLIPTPTSTTQPTLTSTPSPVQTLLPTPTIAPSATPTSTPVTSSTPTSSPSPSYTPAPSQSVSPTPSNNTNGAVLIIPPPTIKTSPIATRGGTIAVNGSSYISADTGNGGVVSLVPSVKADSNTNIIITGINFVLDSLKRGLQMIFVFQ